MKSLFTEVKHEGATFRLNIPPMDEFECRLESVDNNPHDPDKETVAYMRHLNKTYLAYFNKWACFVRDYVYMDTDGQEKTMSEPLPESIPQELADFYKKFNLWPTCWADLIAPNDKFNVVLNYINRERNKGALDFLESCAISQAELLENPDKWRAILAEAKERFYKGLTTSPGNGTGSKGASKSRAKSKA